MSLPAQNPYPQQVAAAGQTVFAFAWRCDDSSLVVVWVNDTQDGGFTVTKNADQTASPGGTIERAVACAAGDIVTIERVNPQTQNFNLTAYNPFTAVAATTAFDRIMEMVQELWAKLARVFYIKRSVQSVISSFEYPAPAAGKVLGWLAAGGMWSLANVDPAGVTVTGIAGTFVAEEVPAGAVNSTDGTDGNGVFTFAHAPLAGKLWVYVSGVRQPPTRYVRVGNQITFNAGFHPPAGEYICADYFY